MTGRRMRILTIHNKYKFRGGEDESRESEDRLLAGRGHEIRQIIFDNSAIRARDVLRVGAEACWSQSAYRRVLSEVEAWRPDVIDVHNFFPLASPAVHHAGRRARLPVVQTLHNYRLLCPVGTFFRNGKVCEDCTGRRVAWPGILHRCYHESALHTGAVCLMITVNRMLGTWRRAVTLFIAVSDFEKRKFVENGFDAVKIVVKPNFVLDPGLPGEGGEDFVFVGRLAVEKGIGTLLRAMAMVPAAFRLKIVGDGPLEPDVRAAAARDPRIEYLGRRPLGEALDLMASAKCLVLPSEWYETFGRVAAEAYARGTPVIAARIGALAEIVEDGVTGLHFTAGDPADLARAMVWAKDNPDRVRAMRSAARREFEAKYTAERNYGLLMNVYERAIRENREPTPAETRHAPYAIP